MKLYLIIFTILISSLFNSLFAQNKASSYDKVVQIADRLVKKKKVPGIAISVIKNDTLVFSKGFGYANLETKQNVNPNTTIFRVASVSKPISAVGLAKAIEAKQMDLDASIYTYLPDFPKKAYDFSLRQLGGHLAGIRNYKGNEFANTKPLTIAEGVALFKNDTLLFKPGTDYYYTSYSWNLIALSIQEKLKIPFEEFIKTQVLQPLGMTNTYADKNQDLKHKAKFYKKQRFRKFKEVAPVHNYFKLASGGYLSTSEDIALFGKALLNDRLLDPEILNVFTTSQQIGDRKTYYGIGFQVSYDHKGRPYYGHVGNGLGGYAIFYVYPKDNVVVSMLMNCSNPNKDKQFNKILDAILKAD